MNELLRNKRLKANYYALLLAIVKPVTAKEALIKMGISPENGNLEAIKCQCQ